MVRCAFICHYSKIMQKLLLFGTAKSSSHTTDFVMDETIWHKLHLILLWIFWMCIAFSVQCLCYSFDDQGKFIVYAFVHHIQWISNAYNSKYIYINDEVLQSLLLSNSLLVMCVCVCQLSVVCLSFFVLFLFCFGERPASKPQYWLGRKPSIKHVWHMSNMYINTLTTHTHTQTEHQTLYIVHMEMLILIYSPLQGWISQI